MRREEEREVFFKKSKIVFLKLYIFTTKMSPAALKGGIRFKYSILPLLYKNYKSKISKILLEMRRKHESELSKITLKIMRFRMNTVAIISLNNYFFFLSWEEVPSEESSSKVEIF